MADVLFVCDSGAEVGGGHVMRCLTLARALAAEGVRSTFLAPPAVAEVLNAFGDTARRPVPAAASSPGALAAAAAAALREDSFAGVVVDHYGFAEAEEAALRARGRTLTAIDDLADRRHAADLLVDPGYGRAAADYAGLLPSGAETLLGPAYALVRPEFEAARARALPRRGAHPVRRVLVSLGLTDLGGVTGRVVELLAPMLGDDVALDVVAGARAPSLPALRGRAAGDPRIRLHVDTTEMASLMTEADLAVGAGGSSTWERACLGLPTLTVVLADNQAPLAGKLAAAGATAAVDARAPDFEAKLQEALARLLDDGGLRASLFWASAAVCDGGGARRVAAALRARLT